MSQPLNIPTVIPHKDPAVAEHVKNSLDKIESAVAQAIDSAIHESISKAKKIITCKVVGLDTEGYEDLVLDIESHLREQCNWRYDNGFWVSSWEIDYCGQRTNQAGEG